MRIGGGVTYDGPEWQHYCLQLLSVKYGTELVVVPDKDRGDLGIEAFSRDGCAFQCYAAQEPLSTSELAAKQQLKMTRDLKKLRDNAAQLLSILGTVRIRWWVFMVSRHDSKRILEHGEKKAAELRAAAMPHLTDDFVIVVVTAEQFPVEAAALARNTHTVMYVDAEAPEQDEIVEFAVQHSPLVATMEEKLRKLLRTRDPVALRRASSALLTAFLFGTVVDAELRDKYPLVRADIRKIVSATERRLELRYGATSAETDAPVERVAKDLQAEIRSRLPGLEVGTAEDVAYGTVADWLMRCPLDFVDDERTHGRSATVRSFRKWRRTACGSSGSPSIDANTYPRSRQAGPQPSTRSIRRA